MKTKEITVFYKWTAKPGNFEELKSIYEEVKSTMEQNEPGARMMHYYVDEDQQALVIHDVFEDGAALGFHLSSTAGEHFPKLVEIAVPGPFFFCGDVPEELKQAAIGMNMGAEFSESTGGFKRD